MRASNRTAPKDGAGEPKVLEPPQHLHVLARARLTQSRLHEAAVTAEETVLRQAPTRPGVGRLVGAPRSCAPILLPRPSNGTSDQTEDQRDGSPVIAARGWRAISSLPHTITTLEDPGPSPLHAGPPRGRSSRRRSAPSCSRSQDGGRAPARQRRDPRRALVEDDWSIRDLAATAISNAWRSRAKRSPIPHGGVYVMCRRNPG